MHFNLKEFECPCCKTNLINLEFVAKLEVARAASGVPFFIMSGYHCPTHNQMLKSPSTIHTRGLAARILCPYSYSRLKIIQGLLLAGFTRITIGPDYIDTDIGNEGPGIFVANQKVVKKTK